VPEETSPPATTSDVRMEGRYQNERRYEVNAVVTFNSVEYLASAEVPPFLRPPASPWEAYSP